MPNTYLLDPSTIREGDPLPRHFARVHVPNIGTVYCDDYLAQQLTRCMRDGQHGVAATLLKWFDTHGYYTPKGTP
jgi:hypothetical protein